MSGKFQTVKDEVIETVAAEVWLVGCGEQMIPAKEAREQWEEHKRQRSQRYLQSISEVRYVLYAALDLGCLEASALTDSTERK